MNAFFQHRLSPGLWGRAKDWRRIPSCFPVLITYNHETTLKNSHTVEPVLGSLVNFLGMRRVNTRGLEQANKCMLMAAIACNLKKLLKFTERKTQINVQAMQANLQALFFIKISLTKQPYLLTALLYVKR